jgi:DNA-binding transcriptional LysR family regulator
LNLDYLRTYLELVRLGSFSEVAKKLSVSQPAVSFQIQKLERDLGVRLIDRGQKPIVPTEAGKRLAQFAGIVDKAWAGLIRDLDRMREEVTGRLVIAASTIPGEVLLPPVLGEFRALHPATEAQVEVSDSLTAISCVVKGSCDVAFCGTAPDGRDLDCFKIAEDEIVLIVFPEHPLARRGQVSFLDLAGEQLISREETSGTQRSLKALLADAGLDMEQWSPGLVLGSTQAVLAAVEAKVGIAFVSNLAIKKSVALGLVKEVPVEGLKLKRDFYCVYRKERVVSRLLAEFIEFVQTRSGGA